MRVLISHESSGKTRDAFLTLGHDAVSCDLLDTSSERPGLHYRCDVYEILFTRRWDLIIAHPECTKLCVSGNHVYAAGKPRHQERLAAIIWTYQFWLDCLSTAEMVCFENPVGVLTTSTDMPKPQYIQPNQFGHDASKKTALVLHKLPELTPTLSIPGRIVESGPHKGRERWANQTDSGQNRLGPSEDRWKLRSETYQGVSDAMAAQWGGLGVLL